MVIHELTHSQCCEVLARSEIGRLACAQSDQPYIVPIHFSFDVERNCVYAFSALGQKVRWMRANPKVCLEIEELEHRDSWTTVVVFGLYEEIHHAEEESEARRRAEQLFRARSQWWLPAAARVPGRDHHHDVVVYRIQIEQLTGRRTARIRE